MKWRPIILSFILGAVCAAGAIRLRPMIFHHMGISRFDWMLRKFSHRLDLSQEQKDQVGAILKSKRDKITQIKNEMEPKFEDVRNTTREEIRKVLKPEQHAKFEKLDAEMRERRLKRNKWAGEHK